MRCRFASSFIILHSSFAHAPSVNRDPLSRRHKFCNAGGQQLTPHPCQTRGMNTTLNDFSRRQLPACLVDLPLVPTSSLPCRTAHPLRAERDSSLAGAGEDVRRTGEGRWGETIECGAGQGDNCPIRPISPISPTCPIRTVPQVPIPAFPIAGFQHHDGHTALPELLPGTALTLRAQPDNPHDPFAVEILHGSLKLGYIPRFCNRHLSRLLQSGVPLACEVARVTADAPPWDAVAIRVSLSQPLPREVAPPASPGAQLLAA